SAPLPAQIVVDAVTKQPIPDAGGNWQFVGAPNFYRIMDYVQVPSRFVGTDDNLTAEIFNDNPLVTNPLDDIVAPSDPRYFFQPPFNKVSRERDPGRVNLNTVTGRRTPPPNTSTPAEIWSDVYDGIMQRSHDANPPTNVHSHLGPAWRDVVLSRRGYAQVDAT